MIKNNSQLKRAKERELQITKELEIIEGEYSGFELEVRKKPYLDELEKLEKDIDEFNAITLLKFEDAVQRILSKPIIIENVGELLAKLRIAAGITQKELADSMGWKQPNLSRFESVNYSSQTVKGISEYVSALGVWLHIYPSLEEPTSELQGFDPEINYRNTDESFSDHYIGESGTATHRSKPCSEWNIDQDISITIEESKYSYGNQDL
jgi:transcriptional regulator with XRE-family HTH domain